MRIKSLAIIAILTMLKTCMGAYYVAPAGSDANPGTEALPWATLNHAGNQVQAGQTVYVRNGTYRPPDRIGMPNHGSAGALVTFEAYPGESPTIKGSEVVTGWTIHSGNTYRAPFTPLWRTRSFFEDGQRLPIVASLADVDQPGEAYFDGSTYYVRCTDDADPSTHLIEASSENPVLLRGSRYIRVKGFKLHQGCGTGIVIFEGASNCEIISNEIAYGSGGNGNNAAGIWTVGTDTPSGDNIIRGNVVFSHYDERYPAESSRWVLGDNHFGIAMGYDAYDYVIEDNIVFDTCVAFVKGGNHRTEYRRNIVYDVNSGWKYGPHYNVLITENILYDIGYFGIRLGEDSNGQVYNNTLYNVSNGIRLGTYLLMGNVQLRNNIICADNWFYGIFSDSIVNVDSDYNCFFGPAVFQVTPNSWENGVHDISLSEYRSSYGQDTHTITSDPMFVDAANHDFHLQPGSPCEGTGESGVDIGAYPMTGAGPGPGPDPDTTPPDVPGNVAASVDGTSVTLTWGTVTNADVAGYTIHYGTARGAYTSVIDLGLISGYDLAGLQPDETYYIALTAFDTSGNRSSYSVEIVANLITGEITKNEPVVTDPDGSVNTITEDQDENASAGYALKGMQVNPTMVAAGETVTILLEKGNGSPEMKIFSVNGALVREFADSELTENAEGTYEVAWEAENISNGLYLIKACSGRTEYTGRLIIAR